MPSAGERLVVCDGCGAAQHTRCVAELGAGACATLGCKRPLGDPLPRAPEGRRVTDEAPQSAPTLSLAARAISFAISFVQHCVLAAGVAVWFVFILAVLPEDLDTRLLYFLWPTTLVLMLIPARYVYAWLESLREA